MTSPVHVWVRSLGNSCRVSADNLADMAVVLDRLSRTEALKGLTTVSLTLELNDDLAPSASRCTIQIPGSPERTLATLETGLADAADLELMLEPGRERDR